MAANLDDIVIEIEARLDRLETSMKQAEKIVDQSADRMDRSVSKPGISLRRALTKSAAIAAGMALVFKAAQVAMKNLDDTAKIFSGNINSALQGATALIRKLEQVPALQKTIFAAVRGLEDVLLLIRGQFSEASSAKLKGASAGSFDAFLNELFGGGALASRRDSLSDAILALRKQTLKRLLIAQATTKQEEGDLRRAEELNQFRNQIEDFRGRAQGLGLTGINKLLEKVFGDFAKIIRLERIKDFERAPVRLQTFRTPLGIARFGQGNQLKKLEILLEDVKTNTANTASNTKNSGPQ